MINEWVETVPYKELHYDNSFIICISDKNPDIKFLLKRICRVTDEINMSASSTLSSGMTKHDSRRTKGYLKSLLGVVEAFSMREEADTMDLDEALEKMSNLKARNEYLENQLREIKDNLDLCRHYEDRMTCEHCADKGN